ncbi:MAG TPA: Fe-S protein assembly co-chaperone HscB [Casimicrobiaceae bacterium]|jgi:molecular chaperone HscB|nr:Fe-S protein assembly co-chaperone HscB [Casimicrobiaceae bacterium]
MIDFSQDYFALFGLPARYRFDPAELDAAYRKLQTEVHPDRFASAGDDERRLALQSSSRVNEAYRALRSPLERANYLLLLRGVDALAETDTALPPEFLEQQLECRESVADAIGRGDARALDGLQKSIEAAAAKLELELAEQLDLPEVPAKARVTLRKLKFLSKVAADIAAAIAEIDD